MNAVEVAKASLVQAKEHRPMDAKSRKLKAMNIQQLQEWLDWPPSDTADQSSRPSLHVVS